jgi:hypothetical protein
MTRFRFELDRGGVDRLARSAEVAGLVNRNAQRVLEQARADPAPPDWYTRTIEMSPALPGEDPPTAVVYSDDSRWHLFEFGTINLSPMRVLTHAVTDAGLEFED